uniref:L-lactate permease n=1 Tax=Oxyrrhis marina TaxID=2969 RepID=A0A7S4GNE7_OXYMA
MAEVRGGPSGFWDVVLLLLPIAFLVFAVVKPKPIPSTNSLRIAAAMMFFIKLVYLESAPITVCAAVVKGSLQALVPCSIIAGAIFLFDSMESSRCLTWMRITMKKITNDHPVAEVMLIGWAFHYLVEGASGFGTPACLAVPVLVSMGHPKVESICVLLVFNGFSAIFGAVGTPLWFGMGLAVGATEDEQVSIGSKCATAIAINAFILIPVVVSLLVDRADVIRNIVFIELSVACTVIPLFTIAQFSAEFPSLLSGLISIACTATLIHFKVGLKPCERRKSGTDETVDAGQGQAVADAEVGAPAADEVPVAKKIADDVPEADRDLLASPSVVDVALRTMPLWLTVVLLIITRIEDIGLKEALTEKEPLIIDWKLGSLGQLTLSSAFVIGLSNILGAPEKIAWSFQMLYVPFIIPFFVAGSATLLVYRGELRSSPKQILGGVARRMKKPLIALLGALCLVELLRGKDVNADAPAYIIGIRLSEALSDAFIILSALLGALGAFFSGSTTVSNLTFGAVQKAAALNLGLNYEALLAVQGCGGSIGNAVCLSNIIAVSTVIGVENQEGAVMKKVVPIVACFLVIATVVMLPFLYA